MLAIDMINLDHTYLCNSHDQVFNSDKRCRGNIRPIINNHLNTVDITDNFNHELVSQHINNSPYTYDSLLAVYVNKYIKEVKQDITQLIFTVPHFFNKTSLNILDYLYTTIHDYIAAAAYLYDLQEKFIVIVPSEFETTVATVNNKTHTITNVNTIPYGSYFIKQSIRNFIPVNISLEDAWTIYKNLQMINKIDISKLLLSVEKSFVIEYIDLTQILAEYYNQLINIIPDNIPIAPFRWMARDKTIQQTYNNIIKTYNPDEAICIGAYRYYDDNLNIKYTDKVIYIDESISSHDDYYTLCKHITTTNMFKEFANNVDEFLIDTNQEANIQFTKKSLHNIFKMIEKSNWKYDNQKKYRHIKNTLIKLYEYAK